MAANCRVQQCVFVVSFPRSGTHLLIDFLRRNFPHFNPELRVWDSASNLYLRIDDDGWRDDAETFMDAGRSHVLVKTHRAGLTHCNDDVVREWFKPQSAIYLYPFRRFSKTVKSFAEFMRLRPPISATLQQMDPFFRQQVTLAECLRAHAETWMDRGAWFIDSDLMLEDPKTTCARIGALLGQTPVEVDRRLPRRRPLAGKPGEIVGRLLGRESTEVVVRRKLEWTSAGEQELIDNEFSDLYATLSERRVN